MPHTIPNGEDRADLAVPPPHVGQLLGADVDEEANQGGEEALAIVNAGDHLLEQLTVNGGFKRLVYSAVLLCVNITK